MSGDSGVDLRPIVIIEGRVGVDVLRSELAAWLR
jgi:hypothetical protein